MKIRLTGHVARMGQREDVHLASLVVTAGIYDSIIGLAGLIRAEGNKEAAT
jgi:hypothetical protein